MLSSSWILLSCWVICYVLLFDCSAWHGLASLCLDARRIRSGLCDRRGCRGVRMRVGLLLNVVLLLLCLRTWWCVLSFYVEGARDDMQWMLWNAACGGDGWWRWVVEMCGWSWLELMWSRELSLVDWFIDWFGWVNSFIEPARTNTKDYQHRTQKHHDAVESSPWCDRWSNRTNVTDDVTEQMRIRPCRCCSHVVVLEEMQGKWCSLVFVQMIACWYRW